MIWELENSQVDLFGVLDVRGFVCLYRVEAAQSFHPRPTVPTGHTVLAEFKQHIPCCFYPGELIYIQQGTRLFMFTTLGSSLVVRADWEELRGRRQSSTLSFN